MQGSLAPFPALDFRRVFANPLRAWNWIQLARSADLPYLELMQARRELRQDHEFQAHLARCLETVHYGFAGLSYLYAVVRVAKPAVMVETGVSSGMSSAHILRALAKNGSGRLYSIDLPNVQEGSELPQGRTTGWIVPDALRDRWNLQLGDTYELLPKLLRSLGHVDVFLHDSDHSYEGMSFEFEQALPKIEPGGLLLSDDSHLHRAWDDFCARHALRPSRVENLGVTRARIRRRS
jgi:predicted O-methyltransferase YrrM